MNFQITQLYKDYYAWILHLHLPFHVLGIFVILGLTIRNIYVVWYVL